MNQATKRRAVESKYVWFYSHEGRRLHFIPEADRGLEFWNRACDGGERAESACGLVAEWEAPGFGSRMYMPRCSRCCRLLDIPQGKGTPFNWPKENGYNPPEART